MRQPKMTRQVTMMFISLLLVLGLLLLLTVLSVLHELAIDRLGSELSRVVITASLELDGNAVHGFTDNTVTTDKNWREQRNYLDSVRRVNHLEQDHLYLFRVDPDQPYRLYFAVMLHDTPFVGDPYDVPEENQALLAKLHREGGVLATKIYADANGTWISAVAPVYDHQGQIAGILQADHRVDQDNLAYWDSLKNHALPILLSFMAVLLPGMYLVLVLTRRAVAPLARVADFAEEMAAGNYELEMPPMRWQELSKMGQSLERMRDQIKAQLDSLKRFNKDLEDQVQEKTKDLMEANDALKQAKDDLEEQATAVIEFQKTHDGLTHLGNRIWFREKLALAKGNATRDRKLVGVLIVGLDRFKRINDSVGTEEGDRVLKTTSARLLTSIKGTDLLARVDGDGFGVILNGIKGEECIGKVARRLKEVVAKPFQVGGLEVRLTCSIGISVFPSDCHEVENLIRDAGIALARAKKNGGDRFEFYRRTSSEETRNRLALESQLRKALEQGELVLHYQPQVHVATGRIIGVESLVRWIHPEKGMVSPGEFIPLAEESGLIVPMGKWIIREAMEARKRWSNMGLLPFLVAINLSGRQFEQDDLVSFMGRSLREVGVDPKLIELEVTESIAMRDVRATIAILAELKAMGMALAIDDFGTGYSSLSYLKQFALDKLKVDRSFINDVTEDSSDVAIVDAIIQLGHSMGLKVIAEGVENQAQLDFLLEHGCDEYQGFFFSKPVPEQILIKLVEKQQYPSDTSFKRADGGT